MTVEAVIFINIAEFEALDKKQHIPQQITLFMCIIYSAELVIEASK